MFSFGRILAAVDDKRENWRQVRLVCLFFRLCRRGSFRRPSSPSTPTCCQIQGRPRSDGRAGNNRIDSGRGHPFRPQTISHRLFSFHPPFSYFLFPRRVDTMRLEAKGQRDRWRRRKKNGVDSSLFFIPPAHPVGPLVSAAWTLGWRPPGMVGRPRNTFTAGQRLNSPLL